MKKIGIIGLGNMGHEMASNLSKSKYKVLGYDSNDEIIKRKDQYDFDIVSNIQDLLPSIDVLITMLPNGDVVKRVLEKSVHLLKPNTTIIDSSTIAVLEAKELSKLCQKNNLNFLDAPVSGGTIGAKNSTLTFMVGGNEQVLNKVEKILLTMGSKIIYCGQNGMGQAAKMCNNMILAATMASVAEALNLSKKLNLNTQKLFDVISTSTASSWAINNYFPEANIGPTSPADNSFKPGFSADLMLKDLLLSRNTKSHLNVKTPITDQTIELYSLMNSNKMGGMDFSAIVNLYKNLS